MEPPCVPVALQHQWMGTPSFLDQTSSRNVLEIRTLSGLVPEEGAWPGDADLEAWRAEH